jgi:hypothetical protein
MAKVHEEIIMVKLSKLVKNSEEPEQLTNDDFETNLEAIVQELVGDAIIVEVERE